MPETRVKGPDGKTYVFPEGVSQDEMRAAMAKRYPKPEQPTRMFGVNLPTQEQYQQGRNAYIDRNLQLDQQLAERGAKRRSYLENDPENIGWSSPLSDAELGAKQYGKSDGAFLGFGDEVVGLFNPAEGKRRSELKDYARKAYPNAFGSGELHGAAVNTLATLPATAPRALQAARLAPKALQPAATGATSAVAWDAAHQMGTSTGDLGERLQNFDLERTGLAALIGAGGGLLLSGAGQLLSKGDQQTLMANAAADIEALEDRSIRPQSLKAFNRLLLASGLSDDEVVRLHNLVRDRAGSVQGGTSTAQGRKRLFQHYMEVLAEDEAGELYNPQAAANILMTVQERANSAKPGDLSRGIVGAAVKSDRESQVPFLQESAGNVAQGTRVGTNKLVEDTRTDLRVQYEAALDPANISPQAQQQAADTIESIRPLLVGESGLKVDAVAEGIDLDALIARNPMKALHWIQSAARVKGSSGSPNAAAYRKLRTRALGVIEGNVDAYRDLRMNYASNEGLDKAKTFGDRLFGGSQNNVIMNPGMRAELVEKFNALTDVEKNVALVSIRDQALGRLEGSMEDAPARTSQLNSHGALSFLEQVGQKQFADDIRAVARENQLLSVADAGNPLRQSATFSNAQARAEAPALYNSKIANAVDNSTPGTLLGEGMLMAFAPHYQGAYAAYRGGRLAASMGLGTRTKTLEDMTRFLMSRPEGAPQGAPTFNAFARQAQVTGAGGSTPPVANAFATPSGANQVQVNSGRLPNGDMFVDFSSNGSQYGRAAGQGPNSLGETNDVLRGVQAEVGRILTEEKPARLVIGAHTDQQERIYRAMIERAGLKDYTLSREMTQGGPQLVLTRKEGAPAANAFAEPPVQNGLPAGTNRRAQENFTDTFQFNSMLDDLRSDSSVTSSDLETLYSQLFPNSRLPTGLNKSEMLDRISRERRRIENLNTLGLPGGSTMTGTIAGTVAGGTSGSMIDYNQDGKIDAADMAIGALVGGGLGAGAGRLDRRWSVPSDVKQNMFVGARSQDPAVQSRLARAQEMEKAGKTKEQIWSETMVARGPDGKWRAEIDDTGATFTPDTPVSTLGEALDHPELYKSYPEMRNLPFKRSTETDWQGDVATRGSFNPKTDEISVHDMLGRKGGLSTALHEGQHYIQKVEDLARGGSPDMFLAQKAEADRMIGVYNNNLSETYRKMEALRKQRNSAPISERAGIDERIGMLKAGYDKMMELKLKEVDKAIADPFLSYKRLAGEVESRNVQTRMGDSVEQRRATPPELTEDIFRADQIVKFRDGTSLSIDGRRRKDIMKDVLPESQAKRAPSRGGTPPPPPPPPPNAFSRNLTGPEPPTGIDWYELRPQIMSGLTAGGIGGGGLYIAYSQYKAEQERRNQPSVDYEEFVRTIIGEMRREQGLPPTPSLKPRSAIEELILAN